MRPILQLRFRRRQWTCWCARASQLASKVVQSGWWWRAEWVLTAHLREQLTGEAAKRGITVFYPRMEFCTDNGAMIAYAGAQRMAHAQTDLTFAVKPRWELATLEAV